MIDFLDTFSLSHIDLRSYSNNVIKLWQLNTLKYKTIFYKQLEKSYLLAKKMYK